MIASIHASGGLCSEEVRVLKARHTQNYLPCMAKLGTVADALSMRRGW